MAILIILFFMLDCARHDHHRARAADQRHRHVLRDVRARLHAEHDDAARRCRWRSACSSTTPSSCARTSTQHLERGEDADAGRRATARRRSRSPCSRRRFTHRRGVRARRLHERHRRPVLPAVRPHHRRRRARCRCSSRSRSTRCCRRASRSATAPGARTRFAGGRQARRSSRSSRRLDDTYRAHARLGASGTKLIVGALAGRSSSSAASPIASSSARVRARGPRPVRRRHRATRRARRSTRPRPRSAGARGAASAQLAEVERGLRDVGTDGDVEQGAAGAS